MRLNRLIDRVLGRATVLEPRKPSLFEPTADAPAASVPSLFAKAEREARPNDDTSGLSPSLKDAARPPSPQSSASAQSAPRAFPLREIQANPTSQSSSPPAYEAPVTARPLSAAASARGSEPLEPPRANAAGTVVLAPVPAAEPVVAPPAGRATERLAARNAEGDELPAQPQREEGKASAPRKAPVAEPEPVVRPRSRLAAPPPLAPAHRDARRSPAQAEKASEPVPHVHVTIGRVEVRAVAPPAAPRQNARRADTSISLQDYLHQRERRR